MHPPSTPDAGAALGEQPGSSPAPAAPEHGAKARPFAGPGALRKLALRASTFEMVGYGSSQVLRLASNLILSRMLFPEAFGLVALVNIFNTGLILLSDVGIEPAVIQNSRGDDPKFLNTAWTIQVIRGFALYGIALVMAWPMAAIYREPQLAWLICVGSLSVVLSSLASTALISLRRRLALGRLALIELGSQVASMVVMIAWAYLHRSVWALVGGLLAGSGFRMVLSHLIDVGYEKRLQIEGASRDAIFHFGKWIFASSAVHFVSKQGDRLLLGRFVGFADLGVYSIAIVLSEAVSNVTSRLTSGVLYPILSRVRDDGQPRLRDIYYRARLVLDGASLPALGVLTMLGPWVVHVMYDDRYAQAGWILQAFALRVALACVLNPCETCLVATGQTRYGLYQNAVRLAWIVTAVPLGAHFFGLRGIVYATALSELPIFFVLWPPFVRSGMLRPLLELRAAGFYLAGVAVGWLLSFVLHA